MSSVQKEDRDAAAPRKEGGSITSLLLVAVLVVAVVAVGLPAFQKWDEAHAKSKSSTYVGR